MPLLRHALQVADHVALVCTLNHLWTKARRQDVQRAGFGLHRILEFDAPRTWQVTGFQLGLVLLTRGYRGPCTIAALPRGRARKVARCGSRAAQRKTCSLE